MLYILTSSFLYTTIRGNTVHANTFNKIAFVSEQTAEPYQILHFFQKVDYMASILSELILWEMRTVYYRCKIGFSPWNHSVTAK